MRLLACPAFRTAGSGPRCAGRCVLKTAEEANMAQDLREKLVDYIQDAHAMEQNVLRMLDSMISTTKDGETLARLQQHRRETERHELLMRGRLEALGQGPSMTAEATAIGGAMLKGVGDQ